MRWMLVVSEILITVLWRSVEVSLKYDYFKGKFDCLKAIKINVPFAKLWIDSYDYVRFDVELASGPQFSVMYSSKQKGIPPANVMHVQSITWIGLYRLVNIEENINITAHL